jgi:AraC-like DNA-binding protein/uncharacterized membrane protein
MILDITKFFVSISIFLFLFFGIFLFLFKKGDRLVKNFLGLFFLSLGLAITDIYLFTNGFYYNYPHFAFVLNSIPLAYGPLLWLLTKAVTQASERFKKIDLIHFAPLFFSLSTFLFFYHFKDIEYKKEFIIQSTSSDQIIANISSIVVFASILIYILFCFLRISSYRKIIKEQFSNVDKVNLSWLLHTLIGFSIIISLSLLLQVAVIFSDESPWFYISLCILLLVMLIFIMSSIVKGLTSDVLISNSLFLEEPKNYGFTNETENKKLQEIVSEIEAKQLYLDSNLYLKSLAEMLSVKPRELSSLINKGRDQSFFDFINSFRINHAKEVIKNNKDPKLTILEVMYASGFNSKSSFNTAFKKHAGCTPSEWRRNLK